MHLQNKIMQLRKVCSHPFLFHHPIDRKTGQPVVSKQLIEASGKMLLLNRLLVELFARGHKVLIFSQFTSMLDIIQDWATEFKGWDCCRIDGSTSNDTRRDEMVRFTQGGNDVPLFLLSTRAGGLGVNLVAADTVIFYDSDWVSGFKSPRALTGSGYRIPKWTSKHRIARIGSDRPDRC